ncbi:hypothetical protein V496_10242, partial [Pseudogymnoascus sp. VKM F-4515 (FW-2607)]
MDRAGRGLVEMCIEAYDWRASIRLFSERPTAQQGSIFDHTKQETPRFDSSLIHEPTHACDLTLKPNTQTQAQWPQPSPSPDSPIPTPQRHTGKPLPSPSPTTAPP